MAKSNYHMQVKGKQGGRRKKFPNGGSPKWLRTRHRLRKKLVR